MVRLVVFFFFQFDHVSSVKCLSTQHYMYIYVFINYTCRTILIYYVHYKIPQNLKRRDKTEMESSSFFCYLSSLCCLPRERLWALLWALLVCLSQSIDSVQVISKIRERKLGIRGFVSSSHSIGWAEVTFSEVTELIRVSLTAHG